MEEDKEGDQQDGEEVVKGLHNDEEQIKFITSIVRECFSQPIVYAEGSFDNTRTSDGKRSMLRVVKPLKELEIERDVIEWGNTIQWLSWSNIPYTESLIRKECKGILDHVKYSADIRAEKKLDAREKGKSMLIVLSCTDTSVQVYHGEFSNKIDACYVDVTFSMFIYLQ